MVAVFCFHLFSQDDDVSCNGSIVHKTERKESLGMLCHTRQDGTCREGMQDMPKLGQLKDMWSGPFLT